MTAPVAVELLDSAGKLVFGRHVPVKDGVWSVMLPPIKASAMAYKISA